jgi:glutamate:Na+ symporter, ESS family
MMLPISLDATQTVALAGTMLMIGYLLTGYVGFLKRYNIPAPVVGGLLIALAQLGAYFCDTRLFQFTTTIQNNAEISKDQFQANQHEQQQLTRTEKLNPVPDKKPEIKYVSVLANMKLLDPFQQMFFASLGFGASLGLLRIGGPQVARFFLLALIVAVLQNVVGIIVAWCTNQPPLFGVLCGSVTLTGGPATGLAFQDAFSKNGLSKVSEIALASGMGGIICGGLFGGPLGKFMVERLNLKTSDQPTKINPLTSAQDVVEEQLDQGQHPFEVPDDDWSADGLLKALVLLLIAMALGGWISPLVQQLGRTLFHERFELPAYIGAMIAAGLIRNLDDFTRCFKISQRMIDDLGNLALGIFIVLALMNLRLWDLAAIALPLFLTLLAQVLLLVVVCSFVVFRMMGRDYEAAVMSSGFYGFMMGTTANAMANMRVLVERYGPAPRAFLVVPIVGAFLIDFTNAILIVGCLNFLPQSW